MTIALQSRTAGVTPRELQDRLRLRPFGTRSAAELTGWLLPRAIENDRLAGKPKL
jgi:hypothetical protein